MRTLWILLIALLLLTSSIAPMACGGGDDIEEEDIEDVVAEGLLVDSYKLTIEVVGRGRVFVADVLLGEHYMDIESESEKISEAWIWTDESRELGTVEINAVPEEGWHFVRFGGHPATLGTVPDSRGIAHGRIPFTNEDKYIKVVFDEGPTPRSTPTRTPIITASSECPVDVPWDAKHHVYNPKLDYWTLNGVKVGPFEEWWDDQQTQPRNKCCYDLEGRKHGLCTNWYPGGKQPRESFTWEHGLEYGPFTRWWENGSIRDKGEYVNGKLEGTYESFREDETPFTRIEYFNGREAGDKAEYGRDGQPCRIWEGLNVYDENGKKLFFTGTYTDLCRSPETGTWIDVFGEDGKLVEGGWH